MSSPRNILVTGGAGFIGSHLVELLLQRGNRVVVIDDLSTGRRGNLQDCGDAIDDGRLKVIEAGLLDLMNEHAAGKALADFSHLRFDAIYHLAAAVGVRLVVEQPIHTIETNVLETCALLQFAQQQSDQQGSGVPTFIASTSEVYGKGVRTPFSENDDVVYGATIHNRWSYACSKAIDEFLALAYLREHGLPIVIGRLFNTVGPRQRGDYGMVLPRFVARALADQPIEVHGDGLQSRCFCDVRDVVPAIVKLVERRKEQANCTTSQASGDADSTPSVFNIGSDHLLTIVDLANLVKQTLGSKSEIVHVPYDAVYGHGFDDMRTRQPDLTRIREAIGFQTSIPLEQTIRDIASDLTANPEERVKVLE